MPYPVAAVRGRFAGGAAGAGYLVYDTFTDTNATPLVSHTPDTAPVGSAWAWMFGTGLSIQSNSLDCTGGTPSWANIDSGNANVSVKAATMILGTYVGLVARGTGDVGENEGIMFHCQTTEDAYALFANQGAYTEIASAAATLTPGDVVTNAELNVNGTAIEFLIDGVSKVSATSSVWLTQTQIGIHGYNENGTADWDDLTVTAL